MTLTLRPSGAEIWTKCSVAPQMIARMPTEAPSDPAREGTCAAWLAEMVLTGKFSKCADGIGAAHENGWIVTEDMANDIQSYVDLVLSRGGEVHTERKVRLNTRIAGTPDAFAVIDKTGHLHVDDLKYGFRIVEPYQNPQISIYAGAIVRLLTARGIIIRHVQIGVYQPRAWHPAGIYRTWSLLPEDLMQHVQWIEGRGEDAAAPDPVATPGEHCRYCEAMATCPVAARSLYDFFEDSCIRTQRHMTGEELARELDFLAKVEGIFEGRKTSIEAEAEARIKRGQHVPGWHMQERRGNSRFTVPAVVVQTLTGINPVKEGIMTPAELIRAGASEDVVKKLTDRPALKPVLKPVPKGYFHNLFPKA